MMFTEKPPETWVACPKLKFEARSMESEQAVLWDRYRSAALALTASCQSTSIDNFAPTAEPRVSGKSPIGLEHAMSQDIVVASHKHDAAGDTGAKRSADEARNRGCELFRRVAVERTCKFIDEDRTAPSKAYGQRKG
jgi:hypothetical protein